MASPPGPILKAWRTLVARRDPVQVCHWFVSQALEQRVLPAFPEPGADYQLFARALAPPLVRQALTKLAGLYPDNAKRGVTALIRARKTPAYRVCAEAVELATTLYALDNLEHPDDRLATRVSRLYAAIEKSSLESWQGQPADRVGALGDVALLFAVEAWVLAIFAVFPESEWAETVPDQPNWRWILLDQAQTAEQLPWPVPVKVLRAAGQADTPMKAARLIVSKTAPLARGCAPASLIRRLKRARRWLAERVPSTDAPDSPPAGG